MLSMPEASASNCEPLTDSKNIENIPAKSILIGFNFIKYTPFGKILSYSDLKINRLQKKFTKNTYISAFITTMQK
jgi:hypothetical protein